MDKLRSLAVVFATAPALTGCSDPSGPTTSVDDQALYGLEGTLEYALDAPWRLDPLPDGTYPPIPIQISFFDEYLAGTTHGDAGGRRLGTFCALRVQEMRADGTLRAPRTYGWSAVADAERQGKAQNGSGSAHWPYPDDANAIPTRTVCQPNQGTCALGKRIRDSSEWHARIDHAVAKPAGTELILRLEAQISKEVDGCAPPAANPPIDALSADNPNRIHFVNWVKVTYGREPLPRFDGDDQWVYADLHYHSQGTDNEGEVAYNYRGSLAAAGAVGIDVLFATDHASDALQLVDADLSEGVDVIARNFEGARDMTPLRWATARDVWLEGAGGVNPASASIWPHARPVQPRVFLGGEVDVIPVVDAMPPTPHDTTPVPADEWYVPYGNPNYGTHGLRFDLHELCEGWTWDPTDSCHGSVDDVDAMFTPFLRDDGTTGFAVHDIQDLNDADYFGRQHLLYLPRSSTTPNGFVGSRTSKYGGATRLFTDGPEAIADEIGAKNGVAFLAHPLSGGSDDKGPGMVPFTQTQLRDAFRHPAIVGLQLWNENARLSAGADGDHGDWESTGYDLLTQWSEGSGHAPGWDAREFELVPVFDKETWTWQKANDVDSRLHHGAYTWDELLRYGIDRVATQDVPWLASGEPRKLFMAGGSDAHGDFNYRRTGYFNQVKDTNTSAMGSVRNLVLAAPGGGVAPTQDQLVDALAGGRFAVTDGPALRIAIDRNGNYQYDDEDLVMGETTYVDASELASVTLVVDWQSTEDFGPIENIDLYVGVATDSTTPSVFERTRTYATIDHGVRREPFELTPEQIADGVVADPEALFCGTGVCQMDDGYFLPSTDVRADLRIRPQPGMEMRGNKDVTLDLTKFPPPSGIGRRFYVRAFAKTEPTDAACTAGGSTQETAELRGRCLSRYAFTNPVWAITKNFSGVDCPYEPNSFDRDLDGYPDVCDGEPDVPARGAWSRQAGGTNSDQATAVVHDAAGNVIAGGTFMKTTEIDGAGTLSSPYTNDRDGYVVKYDPDGAFEWVVQLRGQSAASGPMITVADVATDGAGDVYVTGMFTGTLAVNGMTSLAATAKDSYVMKIDGDTGGAMWLKRMSGAGDQVMTSLAIDSSGRVIVGGTFRNAVVYQPSAVTLAGDATDDCVVSYYGAASGNILYARRVGGSGACKGNDVATGPGQRIYLVGEFSGQLLPDPYDNPSIVRTSTDGTDGFLVAFDDMLYAWDEYLGGHGASLAGDASVTAAAVDAAGNLLVAGSFIGVLYGDGGVIHYSPGNRNIQVSRYAPDGERDTTRGFGSATPGFSGSANDYVWDLDVDGDRIALAGQFYSDDMAIGSFTLSGTGDYDSYAAILRGSDLEPLWADDFALLGSSAIASIDLDVAGKLACAGHFDYWYKLDQAHQMLSRGVSDGMIGRIQPLP
jgi:hypothetical protein